MVNSVDLGQAEQHLVYAGQLIKLHNGSTADQSIIEWTKKISTHYTTIYRIPFIYSF